jgi:hypothetical protein
MGRNLQTGVLMCLSVLAVALGRTIPGLFAGGMPQAPGEDVLALILGDARQELSGVLLDKVDEYFHGGVRPMGCESGLAGTEAGHVHTDACKHDHGAHDDRDDHDASGPKAQRQPAAGAFDPWVWINRQVHTQEDLHLEEEKAVELLPWLWAASRSSPKNVQAFQVGAYVLASMVKKPEEAARLLEEGVRQNPACAELDFSLGELFLNKLHEAAKAEPWFLSARAKCQPAEGPEGDEARGLQSQALFYLGYLAKQRGERERAGAYLRELEALNPEHVCAKNLRALLDKPE